ncbi:hypothetical protein WN943_017001 [Citrus x changshan-huyou]
MDCFDLADENEFALPDLNDEVHIEQVTAIEDFVGMMATNDDRDVFADESCLARKLQKQAFYNLGRQALSHGRQHLVSQNYTMLVSVISIQACCNLGRQDVISRATMLVSPNYRMIVSIISSQACCNLGRQQHVTQEINVVSPNYRMFAWR